MARRGSIDLLRLVDLLQEHITPALCHAAFGRVRKTERQRAWPLDALVRFWIAVILRAPKALRQALAEAQEDREPLFPRAAAPPRKRSSSAAAICVRRSSPRYSVASPPASWRRCRRAMRPTSDPSTTASPRLW